MRTRDVVWHEDCVEPGCTSQSIGLPGMDDFCIDHDDSDADRYDVTDEEELEEEAT